MKKEEKEELVSKIFKNICQDKFSEEELRIINYLQFFHKDIIEVVDKVAVIDTSFKVVDIFEVEIENKKIRCFVVNILHDSHSSLCIKFSKVFEEGRAMFLGFRGLDFLLKNYYERINDLIGNRNLYSFESKKSANRHYIPGISKDYMNKFQRILPNLDVTLRNGNFFVVFKEF
jgi:hypothetical protein